MFEPETGDDTLLIIVLTVRTFCCEFICGFVPSHSGTFGTHLNRNVLEQQWQQ